MAALMTIGQVADAAGVATSALRYYDALGLVEPATRISGQRRYDPGAVRRLRIIEICQRAGFTLKEIGQLLDGEGRWQELATRKGAELRRRIDELQAAATLVEEALACDCQRLEDCGRAPHVPAASSEHRGRLTDPTY